MSGYLINIRLAESWSAHRKEGWEENVPWGGSIRASPCQETGVSVSYAELDTGNYSGGEKGMTFTSHSLLINWSIYSIKHIKYLAPMSLILCLSWRNGVYSHYTNYPASAWHLGWELNDGRLPGTQRRKGATWSSRWQRVAWLLFLTLVSKSVLFHLLSDITKKLLKNSPHLPWPVWLSG